MQKFPALGTKSPKSAQAASFRFSIRVVLAAILIWFLLGLLVFRERAALEGVAKQDAIHLSAAASQIVQKSLTISGLVVDSMLDWLSEESVATEEDYRLVAGSRRFFDRLQARTANLMQIEVATAIALDGTVLNFTRGYPAPHINLSDRDYFREQLHSEAPLVSVGNVVKNRGNGEWTFYLAKSFKGPKGEKLGVVIVGVRAKYIAESLDEIRENSGEKILLLLEGGTLLASSGDKTKRLGSRIVPADLLAVGAAYPSALFDALVPVRDRGWFVSGAAVKRIPSFPALIVVFDAGSQGQHAVLNMMKLAAAVGIVLTLSVVIVGWRNYHLFLKAERAIRQEGERRMLSTLFGAKIALAALLDDSGRIFFGNEQFTSFLSPYLHDGRLVLSPATKEGEALSEFFGGCGDSVEFTIHVSNEAGGHTALYFKGMRMELPEIGSGIALLGYDDTRRLEAEARIVQASKMVTLGEMATSMAHELNQPLNVIKMAGQSALFEIEDIPLSGAAAGAGAVSLPAILPFIELKLRGIVAQVDRAASIIDHMRIFGRAPQGSPPVSDAAIAVRSACSFLVSRLRELGITLEISFENEPLAVRCHPTQLEQVLLNIIINARDSLVAAGTAAAAILITAARIGEDVVIVVADNGPGIPPQIRNRVFEPFFTTKAAAEGTGLGLAITYGIIRDCGGSIEIMDSRCGCSMRISLPAASPGAKRVS